MNAGKYYAAMYLRLSRDDEDRDGVSKIESNSISNQRELIRSFINSNPDIELYDVYIDDGFTGSNFNRPDFQRMTTDIEEGRVNCVIVKDLSRFGRDYIECGNFLQKIYPAKKVRFIAINDHYDSLTANASETSIMVPVRNFVNDSYSRDISVKIRSARQSKYENGELITPFATYGYKKADYNKNQLVIDEYAAGIVKNIYYWRIMGYSADSIAHRLNDLGVFSPAEYKKFKGYKYNCPFSKGSKGKWSSKAIQRILTNRLYLGHLIQGKTECVNYKVKKLVPKPEDQWICVENTHTPIVSEDEFEIVQNLLRTDTRIDADTKEPDLFSGLLFCADCKERMIRRTVLKNGSKTMVYICSSYNRGEGCERHEIDGGVLRSIVENSVLHYVRLFLEKKVLFEVLKLQDVDFSKIEVFDKDIVQLERYQRELMNYKNRVFEELQKGVLNQDEYGRLLSTYDQQLESVNHALSKRQMMVRKMYTDGVASIQRLQTMRNVLDIGHLDRYALCFLVKEIFVSNDGKIEIQFYFADQLEIMTKSMENARE